MEMNWQGNKMTRKSNDKEIKWHGNQMTRKSNDMEIKLFVNKKLPRVWKSKGMNNQKIP